MIDKIGEYFARYNTETTWFVIGILFHSALRHISQGSLLVFIDLILMGTNYYFWRTRDV